MYLSHHSELSGQRRRSASHIGKPFDHPVKLEPAIEPVGESAEIAAQMFPGDRVIRAMNGVLDVSEHRIDPGEFLLLNARRATAGINTPMRTSFNDGPKARQPVRGHFGVRRQVLPCPAI